jgi:hypothetical protein
MLPGLLGTCLRFSYVLTSIGDFIFPNDSMDKTQALVVATGASGGIGADVVRAFCRTKYRADIAPRLMELPDYENVLVSSVPSAVPQSAKV